MLGRLTGRLLVLLTVMITAGVLAFGYGQRIEDAGAQGSDTAALCTTVITDALTTVGENCGSLNRNSACYGFNRLGATFTQVVPANFFRLPNDRGALDVFERIQTSALDLTDNTWGIALLSVQANLPQTLPGQNVVFMLVGDTQIESGVDPNVQFSTGLLSPVTTLIPAALYADPALDADQVGNVPAGVTLEADAVTEDGAWVRVAFDGLPGWLARTVVDAPQGINLPVFNERSRTPMQSFYFRTGIGSLECVEAPSVLVVQGPQNLRVDLTANGAQMRIGSTIVLSTLPIDPASLGLLFPDYAGTERVGALMQVQVLDGTAIIEPNSDRPQIIPAGFSAVTCLSQNRSLGIDGGTNDRRVIPGCGWTPPRPLTPVDLAPLGALQGFTLNYPITLPIALTAPTPQPTFILPTDTPSGPTLTPSPTFTPSPTPPTGCPPVSFTIAAGDVAGLIAAINAANDELCHPGSNTITLATNAIYAPDAMNNTTEGENAFPSITSAVVMEGVGAIIDALPTTAKRHFHVAPGGALTLNQIELVNGQVSPGEGGAILNRGALTITNSTLADNSADEGGAIANFGTLTMFNSTIANSAVDEGSGGAALVNSGTTRLGFVTFKENTSDLLLNNGGALVLKNTSLDVSPSWTACTGDAPAIQGVVVVNDSSCPGTSVHPNLLLTGLAENGGLTRTFVPQAGSPLRDTALDCTDTNNAPVSADQRGTKRPQGPQCDVGAVEASFIPPTSADVQLAKSVNNLTPAANASVTFTVRATNNGTDPATAIMVRDLLPAGVVYTSHVVSQGAYDPVSGMWAVGDLASGTDATLDISVVVTAAAGSSVTNTAEIVSAATADPNPANNTASVVFMVAAPADLSVTKTVDNAMPLEGDQITFTVQVTNPSLQPVNGVQIADSLAGGAVFVSATPSVGTFITEVSVWLVGTVGAGQTATLTLVYNVGSGTGGSTITNTATIVASGAPDPNPANNSASVDVMPQTPPSADLMVDVNVMNASPAPNDGLTVTIDVLNSGPAALTAFTVTINRPVGVTLLSSLAGIGSYDGASTWSIPGVAAGAGFTLTLLLEAPNTVGVTYDVSASAAALPLPDPNPADNSDTASFTVSAPTVDVAVFKLADTLTPTEGGSVVFTVEVQHISGAVDMPAVVVTDLLPAGLTYITDSATQGTYTPLFGQWDVGTLTVGATETLTIQATVNLGTGGMMIDNTASLTSTGLTDINPANNSATTTLDVQSGCAPFTGSAASYAELVNEINAANDDGCHPGANTITLTGAFYDVNAVDNTVNGPSGLPKITSNITINGSGAAMSASAPTRFFYIVAGGELRLNNFSLINGAPNEAGGAIYNEGVLTLNDMTISANSSGAFNGGAIYNDNTLTISGTRFSANTTSGEGGAIYNTSFGVVSIDESLIEMNVAAGFGGAVRNLGGIFIAATTFSGNQAASGGALYDTGNATITNSTFSGNTGSALVTGGFTDLAFVTLADNPNGALTTLSAGLRIKNIIVANNGGTACSGAPITLAGLNLTNSADCSGYTFSASINLGVFGSNGGFGSTYPLLPGSSAIDTAADCTNLLGVGVALSQNGVARPAGLGCDVGAFEAP